MRPSRTLPLAALLFALPLAASDKPRPAPPTKPAAEYPLHDAHPTEKVTLAADPCLHDQDCPFFRLNYIDHGMMPVRVIITNDRDEALILDDVRMQFIDADNEKEAAANDEDLNRRLFSGRYAQGTKIPVIGITIHHEPIDSKIVHDGEDFGFQSTTIPPHSTRAGYIFYDTKGIDDPVLPHAELYIKMIHYVDEHTAKHELFAFTLPFDKYLEAQPKLLPKSQEAKPHDAKP